MQKYKGVYVFKFSKDTEGKAYNKEMDNYISSRGGACIYRYNEDILVFESPKKIRLTKKDDNCNIIKDYSDLVLEVIDTDSEREIFFKEENIDKLEELFKIRKPKQLSEEQREKARLRMINFHKNKVGDTDSLELEEDSDEEIDIEKDIIDIEEEIEPLSEVEE